MISDAFQVNWCCEHSHLPHNYSVIFFILFHVFTDLSLFVLGLKSLFGIWEPWPLCIKENKCHCLCSRSLRWNKAEVSPPHEVKILPRQDTLTYWPKHTFYDFVGNGKLVGSAQLLFPSWSIWSVTSLRHVRGPCIPDFQSLQVYFANSPTFPRLSRTVIHPWITIFMRGLLLTGVTADGEAISPSPFWNSMFRKKRVEFYECWVKNCMQVLPRREMNLSMWYRDFSSLVKRIISVLAAHPNFPQPLPLFPTHKQL